MVNGGEQTRRLPNLSLLAAGGTVLHVIESYLPALGTYQELN